MGLSGRRATVVGKVLGGLGLVILVTSPFTLLVTGGSGWFAAGKAAVGALFLAVFVATNFQSFTQLASRRSSFYFASSAATVLLVLVGLVAVNVAAAKRNRSWDFTPKRIFSLAPQSVSALEALPEKVRAIGFLQPSHPYYGAIQNLLERYRQAAPEKFTYDFKDPAHHPDLAAQYQLRPDQTTVVLIRGEGETATHAALQVLSEDAVTQALLKLTDATEHKAYFLVGHGEWALRQTAEGEAEDVGSVAELKASLAKEGYLSEPLNLAGRAEVPRDAALLVVAGPKSPLTAAEVATVERYLDGGGRVLLFTDVQRHSGLDPVLTKYGVQVDEGIVADEKFAAGSPYVVASMFYSDHPIASALSRLQLNVQLPTTRALTLLREGFAEGVRVEPVVLSSPVAWLETTPDEAPSPSSGEKVGQMPLVAASTRPTSAVADRRSDQARLVVFGDSELLLDAFWGDEPNRNLVMNAFAWAAQREAQLTLRPPDRDFSTLEVDEPTLSRIRFLATDLFPLALLGLGLAIWTTRRNQ